LSDEEYARAITLDDSVISALDALCAQLGESGASVDATVSRVEDGVAAVEALLAERKKILWGI
ncbi:MAG TPA: hypothetical protein VF857_01965, partial [Spirochaetota bacterium]